MGCLNHLRYLNQKCIVNHNDATSYKEIAEANILARFVKQKDYHYGNVGLIIEDGKIVNYALIDFDHALVAEAGNGTPPKTYRTGIDNALKSIKLITSFDIGSLNKLDPIFIQLGEKTTLDEIKDIIKGNLMVFEKEIEACKIAKKIISGECGLECFDELIDMGALEKFTSERIDNMLMKPLYKKRDVPLIVKYLIKENNLVKTFIHYCFKHNDLDLLYDVGLELKGNKTLQILAEKILDCEPLTTQHLHALLNLIEKMDHDWHWPDHKSINLIKRFLTYSDNLSASELIKYYKENNWQSFSPYKTLVEKILIIRIRELKKDVLSTFLISFPDVISTLCILEKILNDHDLETIKKWFEFVKNDRQNHHDNLDKYCDNFSDCDITDHDYFLFETIKKLIKKGYHDEAIMMIKDLKITCEKQERYIMRSCDDSQLCSNFPSYKERLKEAFR